MSEDKRVTKTDITVNNASIRDYKVYGITAKVSFTVSRDDEAKKLGEFEQLEDITWDFVGCDIRNILAAAIANERVAWQANIKANWDKFDPATLKGKLFPFGEKPFGTTRTVVQKVTTESAKDHIKGLPLEEQQALIAELMKQVQAAQQSNE